MTTATSEPEQRIAIWSLPARVVGVYFVIFLIQYVPSVAFETYSYQRAADEAFARTVIEIIKVSGPIGIGSATNALAVAMLVEAVMVLASIINRQKREEGIKEGIKIERKRSNAKLRAWAKENGIPEDKLPLAPED